MHGSLDNVDLSFLVGASLLQVCVGENELILHFDKEIGITVESTLMVRDAQGGAEEFTSTVPCAGSVAKLLGDSVTSVRGDSDGTLSLMFARGSCLEMYRTSSTWENYSISHGKEVYVV